VKDSLKEEMQGVKDILEKMTSDLQALKTTPAPDTPAPEEVTEEATEVVTEAAVEPETEA